MDHVHSVSEKPFRDIRHAAIAICSIDPEQRHMGVLHREDNSESVLLLHLAWHHDLRNHEAKEKYLWIDPTIPARRLRQVAAVCRKVWKGNGRIIPYAFSAASDCFDKQTGRYLIGPTRFGLTCATFVLSVFETAGLSLIKYDTWPDERPGDAEWQQRIISNLTQKPSATPDHIAAVTSEFGSARYRPEEVAGAATINPTPAAFSIVIKRSQQILRRLENPDSQEAPLRRGLLGTIWHAIGWPLRALRSVVNRVPGD